MKELTKKTGDFPTNARIKIKHNQGKPEIEFEYPDNQQQLKDLRHSNAVMILTFIFTFITFLFGYMIFVSLAQTPTPTCFFRVSNYSEIEYENGTYFIVPEFNGMNFVCINPAGNVESWSIYLNYNPLFRYSSLKFLPLKLDSQFSFRLFFLFLILFIWIAYSQLIALIIKKTKFGRNFFPRFNKKLLNKKFLARFTTCPKNKIIEIPLFTNIYMDYAAEGEFSKYLKEVNITEHDFKYLKGGRKGNPKEKPNVYLWKATFEFTKRPATGSLEVRWT